MEVRAAVAFDGEVTAADADCIGDALETEDERETADTGPIGADAV